MPEPSLPDPSVCAVVPATPEPEPGPDDPVPALPPPELPLPELPPPPPPPPLPPSSSFLERVHVLVVAGALGQRGRGERQREREDEQERSVGWWGALPHSYQIDAAGAALRAAREARDGGSRPRGQRLRRLGPLLAPGDRRRRQHHHHSAAAGISQSQSRPA